MVKRISAIAGCIISLAVITGWFINYDARVVKAEDMQQIQQSIKKLNQRIDRSDLARARYDYQQRIWQLEDRYGDVSQMPPGIKNEYRCLQRDLRVVEEKLKSLGD